MSSIIGKERTFIILNQNENVEKNFDTFKKLIEQRSKGEPIAYLIGKKFLEL